MPFIISHYSFSLPEIRKLCIKDTYSLHRVVYGLFDPVRADLQENSGILFADKGMDNHGDEPRRRIVILSQREPRKAEIGTLQSFPFTDDYWNFPAYRFEITINPVRRDNKSGKIIPIRGREAVAEWFCAKAPSWGFSIRESSLQVANIFVDTFTKNNMTVTLGKATLTGFLDVTEKALFSRSACLGIGRARSFGCGLLQIAPAF